MIAFANPWPTPALLAQNPMLDSIRATLSAGPNKTEIGLFVAGALTLLLLILLAARYFGHDGQRDAAPGIDYLTAAVDVLGLGESDRRMLQKIARKTGLDQPAAMLLSPENLAHAVAPLWRDRLDDTTRLRIENLCRQVFDAPLPLPRK